MSDNSTNSGSTCAPVDGLATADQVDLSFRWAGLPLIWAAGAWLLVASLLLLVGAIKVLAPNFIAGCSFLSYGRVEAAIVPALVLGFGVQAGLLLAAWLNGRLGRSPLVGCAGIHVFTLTWNLSLALGVIGILEGDGDGSGFLALPTYATWPMAAIYLVGAALVLLNLKLRQVRELYPSQWFLFLAVVWFGWAFSGGVLSKALLRPGALHYIVDLWFRQQSVWLGLIPVTLAVAIYLIPKLGEVSLQPRALALFLFWSWSFILPWGGIPQAAPLPAWLVGLGVVTSWLALVPGAALFSLVRATLPNGCSTVRRHSEGWLVMASMVSTLGALVLGWLSTFATIAALTDSTSFGRGVWLLAILGSGGLGILAGILHALPRITGGDWVKPELVRLHVFSALGGVVLIVIGQLGGGLLAGFKSASIGAPMLQAMSAARPAYALSVLGGLALAASALLLILLVALQTWRAFSNCCAPMVCSWLQPVTGKKGAANS